MDAALAVHPGGGAAVSYLRRFVNASTQTFMRVMTTLAILVLGGLAWYGLHRDIEAVANPCVSAPHGEACVAFACNVAAINRPFGTLSKECRGVLATEWPR